MDGKHLHFCIVYRWLVCSRYELARLPPVHRMFRSMLADWKYQYLGGRQLPHVGCRRCTRTRAQLALASTTVHTNWPMTTPSDAGE